jgi:hypothetical protein
VDHSIRISIVAVGLGCISACGATHELDPSTRKHAIEGEGFASPIPLPRFRNIDENMCIERIVRSERDRSLAFDGDAIVDLGIFHIHEGVEHTNSAERCFNCAGGKREAHVVMGAEPCRRSVMERDWPDTAEGRKDRADALLGECGKVVLSMGVCLENGTRRVSLDVGHTWEEARQQLMCVNLGGPTGSHSPHPAFVQWIHLREQCPRLAGDAVLHTSSYEPGKLHVGMVAEVVEPELQDIPLCGEMTDRKCRDCGARHGRCCRPDERGYDPATLGCEEGLACQGAEGWRRCLPEPGHGLE